MPERLQCEELQYKSPHLLPLIGTLKPQSNGPLYSNTVIGTLAAGGSTEVEDEPERAAPPPSLLAVLVSVTTSYYSMWRYY